ncbi:Large structural protein, partial [Frankliniella fusca]
MDLSRRYPVGPAGPSGALPRILAPGLPLGLLAEPPRHLQDLQGESWEQQQSFQARGGPRHLLQEAHEHFDVLPHADPYAL